MIQSPTPGELTKVNQKLSVQFGAVVYIWLSRYHDEIPSRNKELLRPTFHTNFAQSSSREIRKIRRKFFPEMSSRKSRPLCTKGASFCSPFLRSFCDRIFSYVHILPGNPWLKGKEDEVKILWNTAEFGAFQGWRVQDICIIEFERDARIFWRWMTKHSNGFKYSSLVLHFFQIFFWRGV